MNEYDKLLPEINTTSKPFWDGAKRHELMAYKCQNCGTHYYPLTYCMACDNPKMEWVRVRGKGKIYTFIVYDIAYHPQWEKHIPYNVAWVELDEEIKFSTPRRQIYLSPGPSRSGTIRSQF